jgi:hypothetical protein
LNGSHSAFERLPSCRNFWITDSSWRVYLTDTGV